MLIQISGKAQIDIGEALQTRKWKMKNVCHEKYPPSAQPMRPRHFLEAAHAFCLRTGTFICSSGLPPPGKTMQTDYGRFDRLQRKDDQANCAIPKRRKRQRLTQPGRVGRASLNKSMEDAVLVYPRG